MAETDDIVASLRAWAPLVASGYTVPAAGQVMENAATALTEQAAQIERLTRERDEARRFCSAAYHDLVGLFETIKANKDLFPRTTHDLIETSEFMKLAAEGLADGTVYEDELSNEKARATTAERERDEARAELERLREIFRTDGEQHAQFVKNLTKAHADRITKYAGAFREMRSEVERKDVALSILAEPANWRTGGLCDPNSGAFIAETIARAALSKGGENED